MVIAQNDPSGTNIGNSAANSTYAELNGTAVASLTNWNDFNTFSPFPVAVGEWLTIDHAISATSSGTKVFTIGGGEERTSGKHFELRYCAWNIRSSDWLVSLFLYTQQRPFSA